MEELIKKVEKEIECSTAEGICPSNIEYVGALVDIHKDLANEEYWEVKKEGLEMRDNYYDSRSRGYGNDSYRENSYGRRRRDSRGRYRGDDKVNEPEEYIERMREQFMDYAEGREQYNRGNYGAKDSTMKSLEYMLESVVSFIEMLQKDASSQEEVELIKKYTREISEM